MSEETDGSGSSRAEDAERKLLLRALRVYGRVLDAEDESAALAPGQTHVYVRRPGEAAGVLLEKRKTFF